MGRSAPALALLAAEVGDDLERARRERVEIERLRAEIERGGPVPDLLWSAAGHLHAFYGAVEAILKKVAERVDADLPRGEAWHRELLRRAALAVEGVRPRVLEEETVGLLRPYLAFRHFFRNAYGVALEWELMERKTARVGDAWERVAADVERFRAFLRAAGEAG